MSVPRDREYVYLGDRMTAQCFKGEPCRPVFNADGKCIRGRGAMLVRFADGVQRVVIARLLRVQPLSTTEVRDDG